MALAVQQPERLQRVRKPPVRSEGPVVAQATHSAIQKAPSFDGAFFHALHSFIHLKRRPFGRPIKVVFSMAFATTGPLRASLDQCPSAATMHPPLGGRRKPQRPCRRASASTPPHGWAAYAKHTPSCPWFRAPTDGQRKPDYSRSSIKPTRYSLNTTPSPS